VKSPAFQFYPRDYLADANVRAMTFEERGVYVELLALEWNEGGRLPGDVEKLARVVGVPAERFVPMWMTSLGPCFTLADEGYFYHPRLALEREKQAAHSARQKAKAEKRWHPAEPTPAAPDDYPAPFLALWNAYPKRAGGNSKRDAFKAYRARLAAGVAHEELAAGVARYARYCTATGKVGTDYVKQAATFLGPGEHWREAYDVPAAGGTPAPNAYAAAWWETCKREGFTSVAGQHTWPDRVANLAAERGETVVHVRALLKASRPWEIAAKSQSAEWSVAEVARRLGLAGLLP
jgi:uncharacterized protein YdaU (DUF1376 family)